MTEKPSAESTSETTAEDDWTERDSPPSKPFHRFFTTRRILWIIIPAILIVAWIVVGDYVSWEEVQSREAQLRSYVQAHFNVAVVIGSVVYLLLSLVPGTAGKAVVYGWLFGFWVALPIVSICLTAAAVLTFLASRFLFREWARRKTSRLIKKMNQGIKHEGQAMLLLTLRLLHAPYSITNYASGATSVRTSTFAWTTFVGMLPGNIVFVLAGASLPDLDRLAKESPWSLIDWKLLVGFSMLALLPLIWKKLASKLGAKESVTIAETEHG